MKLLQCVKCTSYLVWRKIVYKEKYSVHLCFFPLLHTHLLMYSPVRTMLQVWHLKQLTCHCFSNARRDWPCLISAPHPAQSKEKKEQDQKTNRLKDGEGKDSGRKRKKRKYGRGRSKGKEKWNETRHNCTSLNIYCAPKYSFLPLWHNRLLNQ